MACIADVDERPSINFSVHSETGLTVTIVTNRLFLRSVQDTPDDQGRYVRLFGDMEVMQHYAQGEAWPKEKLEERICKVWAKRWRDCDPYSGLAVFRKDTGGFIGHVVLGYAGDPGKAELAVLFHKDAWGQGYGTEAVRAILRDYAPATRTAGYQIQGKPLTTIVATTKVDHIAMNRIFIKLGMQHIGIENKYGALRNRYAVNL
jgi:RimJ/RimL family protein N-acetyltransferase